MPYPYSLVATRVSGEVLTASKYNADHQNHIDNNIPASINDYSTDVPQMRLQTDPGEIGSESLPTTLAAEIERIRFAVSEAKGTQYWYQTGQVSVARMATGGDGTEGNPWTGFETAVNALPVGANVYFPAGYYQISTTLQGKNRQQWYGDGSLVSHLQVVGAIQGVVFDMDLTHSNIYISDLHIYGDSASAPTTLDLLTIRDFITATVERVKLEFTSKNGLRALHGRNLSVRDCVIAVCAESMIHLGGTGADEWCNAWNFENVTCESAVSGVESANGAVRLEVCGYGLFRNLTCELFAGGKGITLNNCQGITVMGSFIEWGDSWCVQGLTTASAHINLIGNHFHTTQPDKLDFATGSLQHTGINVISNAFAGVSSSSHLFLPGSSLSWNFYGNSSNSPSDGEWITGYPNAIRDGFKSVGDRYHFEQGISVGDDHNLTIIRDGTTLQVGNSKTAGGVLVTAGAGGGVVQTGSGGLLSAQWDASESTGNNFTRSFVWDVDEGAFYRVKLGADNSGPGGVGRALVVDNA